MEGRDHNGRGLGEQAREQPIGAIIGPRPSVACEVRGAARLDESWPSPRWPEVVLASWTRLVVRFRWLVIGVVTYTAVNMLMTIRHEEGAIGAP